MHTEMYDRISGYDYKYEVDSHVSKCSFDSYKDLGYFTEDKSVDIKPVRVITHTHNDKGSIYRR